MDLMLRLRWINALVIVLLLSGCSGTETIRGRLNYDLRPPEQRTAVFLPPAPDVPRYRYLGQLIGEPNFEDVSDKSLHPVMNVLKWIAGVFENYTPTLLQRPLHGAVDKMGRIYVVDGGRSAVVVFDPKAPEEEEDERGEAQMLIWGLAERRQYFEGPVAVAPVWDGHIAVSDSRLGLVARLDGKGEPVGRIGDGHLQRPTGLAFDPDRGLLFVADTVAGDIKVYDATGKLVNNFGSPGTEPGEFNSPTYLAFSGGRLYVSDTLNNRIQVFDADGRYIRHFGQTGLYVGNLTRPKGVAAGAGDITYVVESYFGHLLAFNDEGELLMGVNGSGLRGDGFLLPSGVWVDESGRIFVADMMNGRVVAYQFLGGDQGD
jgi:DNA-binding beta-propeller fold protein YncE